MRNERGPFHGLLVDHIGITMTVVVVLCVLGLFASADTHPKDGDVKLAPLVSGAVGNADVPKGSPVGSQMG